MLNFGPNEFEGINENSTDDERLNKAIEILVDKISYENLNYNKLCIPNNKEELFDGKLKDTGFVMLKQRPTAYHPDFKLNHNGRLMLEKYGSYLEYKKWFEESTKEQNKKDDEIKERANQKYILEIQSLKANIRNLDANIQHLENQLRDYPRIKRERKIFLIAAIISIISTVVTLIFKFKN